MRDIVYLNVDLEESIDGLRLSAGLALAVIETIPVAYCGRYSDRCLDMEGYLCEVIGRPVIRIAIAEDLVSDECPEDVLAEGMRRPGHVYEWEAKQ